MRDERDVATFDFPSLPPEIRIHIAKYALGGREIYLPQIRQVALLLRVHRQKPTIAKRFSNFIRFIWYQSLDYRSQRHIFLAKLPYTPPE